MSENDRDTHPPEGGSPTGSLRRILRTRNLVLVLLAALVLHLGWMMFRVNRGLSGGAWESPSVLYGRRTVLRAGDPMGALYLRDRLRRLAYHKVPGAPKKPGTWSDGGGTIRLYTREFSWKEERHEAVRADLALEGNRIAAVTAPSGAPLPQVALEPEEFGRILGPNMETRRPVPLSAIPSVLQDAVLAAEDSRFYRHIGIDFVGTARALWANLRKQRFAQGGSTITQQLAKNFFLSPKKNLWRKLREAELAFLIELRYPKKEILSAYLNKIYLGQEGPRGIYGVEEAARYYFSKPVGELNLEESALLAGMIQSPNRYSPMRAQAEAKARRNWVLSRMLFLGTIDNVAHRAATRAPVRLNLRQAPVRRAAYFADYVRRSVEESLGDEELFRTGYRIHTTLDVSQQDLAERAVTQGLEEITAAYGDGGEPLQAALVAVDPRTGEMTAMVGGRGYGDTQFNRAADAMRQPGSAFKPFVLLAGMEEAIKGKGRLTLSTPVSGAPITLPTDRGPWTPGNYEGANYGVVSVRRMIEDSVNTATVRFAMDIGLQKIIAAARSAGIASRLDPIPSLALGSFEVTPVELAYAYTTLATGGRRFAPFSIHEVAGPDGDSLTVGREEGVQAVDPRAAFLVTWALRGVLDRGTGSPARAMGVFFPASGKTGTTQEYRDSWFVGYTPELVCAVWVGHDSGLTTRLSGARGALYIWSHFMRGMYPDRGPAGWRVPEGVALAVIDPETGMLAMPACPQRIEEAYLSDRVPRVACTLHQENEVIQTIREGARGVGGWFRDLFR